MRREGCGCNGVKVSTVLSAGKEQVWGLTLMHGVLLGESVIVVERMEEM